MKSKNNGNLRMTWLVLALPPFIFLLLIVAASIYYGIVTRGDAAVIAVSVPRSIPVILMLTQVFLLLLFAFAMRVDKLTLAGIGWKLPAGQKLWREILLGSVPGLVIGLLYPTVLAPIIEFLQTRIGDYIPPGELQPALGAYLIPFFVANVLLAPFVEENIYRGYAMTRLGTRYSQIATILITSLFFGLLHWAGGFWYILLTGGFLGVLLASLFSWRKNIIVPFMLHLFVNIIEFLFVVQG